jgi:hypothetical protein
VTECIEQSAEKFQKIAQARCEYGGRIPVAEAMWTIDTYQYELTPFEYKVDALPD